MTAVICDTEWSGLIEPDTCWVIVCREIDDPEKVHVFQRPDLNPEAFNSYAKTVDIWVGHNFIDFDLPNLHRIGCGKHLDSRSVIDTLVVSRLVNQGVLGGHSLEAWAERLKSPISKVKIESFEIFTEELLERCIADTYINLKVYNTLSKYINNSIFKESLRLEHDIQFICLSLSQNGFPFDKPEAEKMLRELQSQLKVIDDKLIVSFPPEVTVVKEFTPTLTKQGTLALKDFRWLPSGSDLSFFKPDVEYSLVSIEPYNPGSIRQTVQRLNEAGWRPTEKTKGHLEATKSHRGFRGKQTKEVSSNGRLERFKEFGWKLSEENLRTLPDTAPESARKLVERLLLASRISDLEEWIGLCRPSQEGFNVHGSFHSIGGWTHRLSTSRPNMQNIPVPQHKDNPSAIDILSDEINYRMRGLWKARNGKRILGVDADGIQMRIFAHYVGDQRLIDALVKGDKKNGTDIHTLHQKALGKACKGRNPAKTFIYAFLLGAGIAKVAEILECSIEEARQAVENFLAFYPGLTALKATKIPQDAYRGYFEGLDGRLVVCDNEHKVLAGYLQNGEAVIMKRACRQWHQELYKRNIPFWFRTWPHDEWQTEIEDDQDLADEVTSIQIKAIEDQATALLLGCPLAGTRSMSFDGHTKSDKAEENTFIGGYSWAVTH